MEQFAHRLNQPPDPRRDFLETDSYLLVVCRYVALNPVRARLCRDPGEWLWSSHRASAGIDAPTIDGVRPTTFRTAVLCMRHGEC